jgi:hypothetical protein
MKKDRWIKKLLMKKKYMNKKWKNILIVLFRMINIMDCKMIYNIA